MGQETNRMYLHEGWHLRSAAFEQASPLLVSVPGTVQEELIRSGLIPDPYYGTHENDVQWVSEEDWVYEKEWTMPDAVTNQNHHLVLEGVDTYADIWLNDSLIAKTDNMFRTWRIPVDGILRPGSNHLKVVLHAPSSVLNPIVEQFPYALNKTAANDTGTPRTANFARKAQFQFGWDWGLRLVTLGIWRPVYLESWTSARINDMQLHQQTLSPEKADMQAHIHVAITDTATYELVIKDVEYRWHYAKRQLLPGENRIKMNFRMDKPRYWWPNGQGEPHRYHIVCELKRNGEVIDRFYRKIGLRTVELVERPDAYGTSFFFKINGRPVFIKGGAYIPQDAILTRITPEQKTTLLVEARDAHMNLIRVWGGGIYEDEHFYDQCDSLGLMVWQDFMFACAGYPGTQDFLTNVDAELRDNIRRLRNHPSIITWCGNNEVFLAMHHWGWQRQFNIQGKDEEDMLRSYDRLFKELIPSVLQEEDPQRPYSHTTPTKSWTKPADRGHGTLHYWGVWHGPDDFSGYETKVGRYMNEYGFQSFPEMATIAAFADSSQWSLDSPVMDHHQKSYIGNGLIGKFVEQYGQPAKDFETFVLQSQQVQYEGMRRAILAHRMRWGYCMGTTFWQLNDCWPGPSWSAIDYYGRHKVFFKELPNLYAPVVATAVGNAKHPGLMLISDRPSAAMVEMKWEKRKLSGGNVLSSGVKSVTVLQPGAQLLTPPEGMIPAADELTSVQLYILDDLISEFKWDGRQTPMALPEGNWPQFPELVR
ncbi:MAG: hypothetical protein R2795_17225 [Saprospiraceae bacterium]